MIQRRQTLYLLGIIVLSFLPFLYETPLLKVGYFENGANYHILTTYDAVFMELKNHELQKITIHTEIRNAFLLLGFSSLIGLLMFSKIELQFRIIGLQFLMLILTFFFLAKDVYNLISLSDSRIASFELKWGLLYLIFAFGFNILAFNRIKSDIRLLASSERFR